MTAAVGQMREIGHMGQLQDVFESALKGDQAPSHLFTRARALCEKMKTLFAAWKRTEKNRDFLNYVLLPLAAKCLMLKQPISLVMADLMVWWYEATTGKEGERMRKECLRIITKGVSLRLK
eukprot:Colp12_sorted_trinity150504_noHs@5830